jgi:hypothetical protein
MKNSKASGSVTLISGIFLIPLCNGYVSVSPSCMMNGFPCPLPVDWVVDWSLYNSTAAMPEKGGAGVNSSTGFTPASGHHWGMVSLDWQVGESSWLNTTDKSASTCEATSASNCARLIASGQVKRCGIYHNIELALQWIESSRAVMYDPTKSDWFLQYTDGLGNKNGTIYNEPRLEGDQYFIDYRNADAAAYFVQSIVNSTIKYNVDLTFTDDRDGIPVEHAYLPGRLNLSSAEVADVQFATQSAGQWLATSLAANGKTCWDCLAGYNLGVRPSPGPTCATTMRQLCDPGMQGRSMFMGYSGPARAGPLNQTLAAFLITRPPIAFFGSRWQDDQWSPLFNLDTGEPTGLCLESPAGVFSRTWSKGVASLDCNSYTAILDFQDMIEE